MDVAFPGNPPFGRSRPPLVAGAGGGEVVAAQRVRCARLVSQGTRDRGVREGAGTAPAVVAESPRPCGRVGTPVGSGRAEIHWACCASDPLSASYEWPRSGPRVALVVPAGVQPADATRP